LTTLYIALKCYTPLLKTPQIASGVWPTADHTDTPQSNTR